VKQPRQILLCFLMAAGLMSQALAAPAHIYETERMGTLCRLHIYAPEALARAVFSDIDAELLRLESITNLIDPQSEIAALNRSRKKTLSQDLFVMLERCLYFSDLSQGAFDPTVGALTLERFGKGSIRASSLKGRPGIGGHYLSLDLQSQTATLTHPDTQVDVWGCGKGYVADQILAILKTRQAPAALIDLGGQISVWGTEPNTGKWELGIEDPADPQQVKTRVLLQSGQTLASSSEAQAPLDPSGQRVAHLFDPRTGDEVLNPKYLSVSVVSQRGIDADILSTAVYVRGSVEWLHGMPDIGYVLVTEKNKVVRHGI
jgi:thiamine biosynthesis lipoprotein